MRTNEQPYYWVDVVERDVQLMCVCLVESQRYQCVYVHLVVYVYVCVCVCVVSMLLLFFGVLVFVVQTVI